MQFRLRTLLPGQFGLLAMFTWTTLLAVAFAIIRLPIIGAAKLLILTVLWGIFRVWNYAKQPQTPVARIHNALLDVVGGMIFPVYFLSKMVTTRYGQPTVGNFTVTVRGLLIFEATMCAVLIAIPIRAAIAKIRAELRDAAKSPEIDG